MSPSRQRLAAASAAAALLAISAVYLLNPDTFIPVHADSGATGAAVQTAPAAVPVDVAPVLEQAIVQWQRYSGRVEAMDYVAIRPLVSGTLERVHFQDGALVKRGDLLFTIDPRPYEAELARAKAQVAAAQARQRYAAGERARADRLLEEAAIARRDVDEKHHAVREADAQLQAAEAALAVARINLGHTRITAPIDGRVSRAEVTPGNVVQVDGAAPALTSLVSVARMYVAFDVDESTYLQHVHAAQQGREKLRVQLGLANEPGFGREGTVQSVDNQLNASSGTIRVRAVVDNRDGALLPGLYARVQLGGATAQPALLVDEKAIGTDQNKRFVLVVDDAQRVDYRQVQLGAHWQGLRVVKEGLQPGEQVVVSGLQRVQAGALVQPHVVSMAPQGTPAAQVIAQLP